MAKKGLNYPAAEINQRLNLAGTAVQPNALNDYYTKTDVDGKVVVDISTRYSASYASLSAALTALNSDTATDAVAIKKGGVSIKFINFSTNKYEQWNLKTSSWSTNVDDWALDVDSSDIPVDKIEVESVQSEEKAVIYETDEGVQVGKIDANGADFINLKRGGQQVARMFDLPTKDSSIGDTPSTTNVPTTKAVKDYVDAHSGGDYPIDTETTSSEDEEQIWGNDAETDTYAKIGGYGIKAKAYYDLSGNPIGGSTQPLNVVAMLPSKINIVEGQNIYICPDSILNNVFANDVHIKYGSAFLTDRTAFNLSRHSTNETVGSHAFNMKIYDKNWKETNDINITVNTISKDVAGTFKICVIGDSKTDNATKLAQLLYLAELDGNLDLTFLGTQNSGNLYKDCTGTPHPIKREGYSGRNISEVCTSPTLNGQTNIFYDANITGNIKFSFAAGVTALNDVPDILWIDHGANQAYNWTNNKKYYDAIIASVAAYNTANNTNVKVVISLQERFGMSMKLPYAVRGDENDAARKPTQESYDQMIEDLEGRESEGVFVCPQYLHIDLWNDFPLFEAPISENNKKMDFFCADTIHMGVNCSQYNASTTYSYGDIVRKGVDMTELYCCVGKAVVGVEPNDDKVNWSKCVNTNAGYYKIADMYYATLKYIASLTN